MEHCELCQSPGGVLVWRGERCRVVLVEEADYPGYCRVIWNDHVAEATDLPPLDRQHMMIVVMKVEAAIRAVMHPDKINLASLGNMTPHLHWHIIPRYRLDRHFPQSIWGPPQREPRVNAPDGWQTQLVTHLTAALEG